MHFTLNKSNTFKWNLKWEIGIWKNLNKENQFIAEHKEHFFVFKFQFKNVDGKKEFLITVEYSPSELAVFKVVNCEWNCKLMDVSAADTFMKNNESKSNLEQSSPVKILYGFLPDLNNASILTFEFLSTYQFITIKNIGSPNIDYSKNMLKEYGIKPDCNIIVKDKIFKVHKFMLTAGSDIFEAIIRSSKNQNTIEITLFDPFVVKDVIKFIYGQKPAQTYFQLYRFSVLYRIRLLMEFCESYFEQNLGPNNIIPIYQQALENDRGYLRHFCVVFYKSNKEAVEKEETFVNASNELKEGLLIPFVLGP